MAEVEKERDAPKFPFYFGSKLNESSPKFYLKVRNVSIKIIKNPKDKWLSKSWTISFSVASLNNLNFILLLLGVQWVEQLLNDFPLPRSDIV